MKLSIGTRILLGCRPLVLALVLLPSGGWGADAPWWMKQTEIGREGSIAPFSDRPWWSRALTLRAGESFVVDAAGEARGRMIVRREKLRREGMFETEAFVWIIDDDGDGSVLAGGDRDSDCYVVDYGCDGIVDRMVDYIDNDGDGDMDELDIRYFDGGRLNWAWFGDDIDDDDVIRNIVAYERGDEFRGDPYGDNFFYMNKYNPLAAAWSPVSECPFAFYDTDGDGYSEIAVRVSAVPLDFDAARDPDYANTAYGRPWGKALENVGVTHIRYSFDVDRGSSKDSPLHYDFGFSMVGSLPYRFAEMARTNPLRRPPQTTVVIPWKDVRAMADRYPARETALSWNEHVDDTVANGADPRGADDYRWEGVFWVWERRFMPNTGGPCQKWNMRREWRSKPSEKRELYYSEIDRRIHLFGAEEGWIEIGHFAGEGRLGEIRMFDTDGNGFFDRWEVYLGDDPRPARVTTVRDERARLIDSDPERLCAFYTKEVLPSAVADRRKLMKAMSSWRAFSPPEGLKRAMDAGCEGYRRYAMDVVCELQYRDLRESLLRQAQEVLRTARRTNHPRFMGDLFETKLTSGRDLAGTRNSHTAWKLIRALAELDAAYGRGDTAGASAAVEEIKRIGVFR